jgi:hypothetical protein
MLCLSEPAGLVLKKKNLSILSLYIYTKKKIWQASGAGKFQPIKPASAFKLEEERQDGLEKKWNKNALVYIKVTVSWFKLVEERQDGFWTKNALVLKKYITSVGILSL